jgi:hypothetical protein
MSLLKEIVEQSGLTQYYYNTREGVTIHFTAHKLHLAERYVRILCVTLEVTQTLASRRAEFY